MRHIIRYFALAFGLLSLSLPVKASLPQVTTGTWSSGGTMASAHDVGCSVLLQDGRLMVIGGSDANGPTANVDIFNTDGTWSSAAAMQSPRASQACAVLQNGQVLAAGGDAGADAVNTAELYDPSANSWSSLPVMTQARSGATASLLQDGRVLLAGGGSNALEIFDPNNQSFSFVGTMSAARQGAAAAVLQDGRVLIVGGAGVDASGNPVVLASSDIFDPSTGVSAGPALAVARSKHSATTQLDGKVAVIGGSNGSADLHSIEIFDPVAGNFSSASVSLATPRSGHLAFLLPKNSEVLVVGGQSAGADLVSAELFIPWDNSVQGTGMMSVARSAASGTPLSIVDGLLMVAGGSSQSTADLYSFATVNTDASDYAPGTIVTITGTGWQPGETVALSLLESPLIDTPPSMTALADGNGNISNNQFSPDVYDLNVRFYLTATGSKTQAQNTFTDSVNSVTITSVSPTSTASSPFTSLPQDVTVSFSYVTSPTGATTGTLDLLGTAVTSSKSLTPGAGSDSLTIHIPAGTPNGGYNVKVTVSNNTGTGANNKNDQKNGAVVINVPTQASQTITFAAIPNHTFGDAPFTISPTASSGLTVSLAAAGNCTVGSTSPATVVITGAGSCTITASQAGNSSFLAALDVQQTFTVAKAPSVVTWANPADIIYGTPLSATQLNATASIGGTFAYTPASGTVLSAGSGQTLSTTFTPTDTINYDTASKSVTVNVKTATLTITASSYGQMIYGDPVPTITPSYSGFVNGDTSVSLTTQPTCSTTATSTSPVGAYVSTCSGAVDPNYTINYVPGSVALYAKPVTASITASDKTYDGTDTATITGCSISGKVGSDDVSCTATNAKFASANASASLQTVTATVALSGSTAGNYTLGTNTIGVDRVVVGSATTTAKINPAPVTISITGGPFTYDGNPHSPTITLNPAITGYSVDYSGSSSAPTNAGTYTVTVAITDSNYVLSGSGVGSITINKADANIVVGTYSGVYDGNVHGGTGTATGVNHEDLTGFLHVGAGFMNVPGGTVNWTFDGNTNYNSTSGSVNIVITQANAAVSVKDYTGVYDGNAHGATGTATGVKGEDLIGLLNLGATFTHVPGGTANWSFAGNTNYKSSNGTAAIVLTQADASITVNSYTGVYDGAAHGATGSATGVQSENLSGLLNLGASFTDVPGGTANWSFLGDTDYKLASGSVAITINKAPSYTTVSVAGGTSFAYDSLPHPATVSVTGVNLRLAPAPVYSCGHAPINVVDSGCTASYTYAGDNNHVDSGDIKTYTISTAALTVTANSASMILDASLPTFTGTVVGVKGSDGITATYSTAATGMAVGTFPITPTLMDPNGKLPNYTVAKNNGTLTVTYALAGTSCDGDAGHQILQPINWDGTSTFKQGSTVPTKFRVCDVHGNSVGMPGVVTSFNLIAMNGGTLIPTVDETVDSTTPDSAFRWDPTAQQWIFNISTKSLPTHYTYTFQINLNDGSYITFTFGLPK